MYFKSLSYKTMPIEIKQQSEEKNIDKLLDKDLDYIYDVLERKGWPKDKIKYAVSYAYFVIGPASEQLIANLANKKDEDINPNNVEFKKVEKILDEFVNDFINEKINVVGYSGDRNLKKGNEFVKKLYSNSGLKPYLLKLIYYSWNQFSAISRKIRIQLGNIQEEIKKFKEKK